MKSLRNCFIFLLAVCLLAGCKNHEQKEYVGQSFEDWYPFYNTYITGWLQKKQAEADKSIAKTQAELAEATSDEEVKKKLEARLASLGEEKERLNFRQSLGDFFQFKKAEDLPDGLSWENGLDEPEIGDPACIKGGVFNTFIPSFPPTITPFGPNSNNSFRGELYDNVELGLIDLHPLTGKTIPAVAKEWAVSEDGRTVFFKLDEDAKYSDGVQVKAVDFMWFIFLRVSDNVSEPWFKQFLREEFAQITVYGDEALSISLPVAGPREKMPFAASLRPSPPHFYKEYGPDYEERYQWRVPPTTGAYTIEQGGIVKGVSITLSHTKNWWAQDKKYYRYRFNADQIQYLVVRDTPKAWELFRAGEIDYFPISLPKYWYEDSEMPPVFNGYIERYTWYNQFPRTPWALYLNTAQKPLDNVDVRLGVAYATNWQRVIDVVWRGDATRLPSWSKGYGGADNTSLVPRPFSVTKAREAFARAGYTKEGTDGILRKPDGTRLELTLSFTKDPSREQMMVILKEEARKAGLDFVLDGQDATANYKKVMEKKHQIAFSGWGFQPPYPRFYEYFHSENAYDAKGNLVQNTNNIFSYSNERMDELCLAYRKARTEEEMFRYAWEMQQIIHDEAIFIPGWMTEFSRIGCWRWMRWPNSKFTEFSPPSFYVPVESYTWWIDAEMKKETLEARRSGKKFLEVQKVMDRYRTPSTPSAVKSSKEAENE